MTDTATTAAPTATGKPKRKDPRTERSAAYFASLPPVKRPEDVKAVALAASVDALLSAQSQVTCTPTHIDIAANLIDEAASTLPPQRKGQDANGEESAQQAQDCSEIRDGAGFMRWVEVNPALRGRVAVYLSECAKTGKLAASMDTTGMTIGSLSCLEQRHPVIRSALALIRNTHARKLVSRARETVEDVMLNPDDQTIQLRAAGLAMQYGPKDGGSGSGEGSGDAGGVQIVINMGAPPPVAGAAIPMEQVKGKSLFVQSR